jgi:hypothetical protein
MVVDTIIKPNRNSVATSLGHKLQGQNQDDDIEYVKELICYIEEVRDYGFEHMGSATLDFFIFVPRV